MLQVLKVNLILMEVVEKVRLYSVVEKILHLLPNNFGLILSGLAMQMD